MYITALHLFGAINLKKSTIQPQESQSVCFFHKEEERLRLYIESTIFMVLSLVCCPSWYHVFDGLKLRIDYTKITSLTLAEGVIAAMRLKLRTANLTSCHNV